MSDELQSPESEDAPERTKEGKFLKGQSGNKLGRPKGSKNKITLLKLMAEEAARERNADLAQQVIDGIYRDALEGDRACRKLVWDAHMSKGTHDDRTQATEKTVIQIGSMKEERPVVEVQGEVIEHTGTDDVETDE